MIVKKLKASFFVLILLNLLVGCKGKVATVNDLKSWINNPKQGLVASKSVNGVKVNIHYLPPQYNALKEMESTGLTGKASYDSLLLQQQKVATFLMVLAPDEDKGTKGDIMYKDIQNFKQYVERSLTLNFDLENQIELKTDKGEYKASLSSLENTYSLTNDRKINFVFTPTTKEDELTLAKEYDFIYNDESFGLGTLHFYFNKKEIEASLPEITVQ